MCVEQLIEQMVEQAEKLETGGMESGGSREGSVSGESGEFSSLILHCSDNLVFLTGITRSWFSNGRISITTKGRQKGKNTPPPPPPPPSLYSLIANLF